MVLKKDYGIQKTESRSVAGGNDVLMHVCSALIEANNTRFLVTRFIFCKVYSEKL
jgi:hypothetical protein